MAKLGHWYFLKSSVQLLEGHCLEMTKEDWEPELLSFTTDFFTAGKSLFFWYLWCKTSCHRGTMRHCGKLWNTWLESAIIRQNSKEIFQCRGKQSKGKSDVYGPIMDTKRNLPYLLKLMISYMVSSPQSWITLWLKELSPGRLRIEFWYLFN